jgi:hypothetical protein
MAWSSDVRLLHAELDSQFFRLSLAFRTKKGRKKKNNELGSWDYKLKK